MASLRPTFFDARVSKNASGIRPQVDRPYVLRAPTDYQLNLLASMNTYAVVTATFNTAVDS